MNAVNNSLLSRVSRIIRVEGVRGALRRIRSTASKMVGIEYAYILLDPLVPAGPVPEPKVDVQVQQVTAEDALALQELSALVEKEYRVESAQKGIRERLSRGELCYISRVDGRVVGHMWIRVSGAAANEYEQLKFYLAPDEVYYHDVYVAPEQRGKNICPAMLAVSGCEVAERIGKTQSVAVVLSTNRSSLNTFRKFGSKRVGVIGHWKLFGTKHPFLFRHRPIAL